MKQTVVPFHKPRIHPESKAAILEALEPDNSLFEGKWSQLCKKHILEKYCAADLFFTSSCTEALSMASILLEISAGDEVILPAYTFVSVANAFANRGIIVRLADSLPDHPNCCPDSIKSLISNKTKAIVFMAYGGQNEGIEKVQKIATEKGIWLIEDAAHSYDSKQNGVYVGKFGHLSTFSFHQSKSVHCGQGGMLLINDKSLVEKAKTISTHGADKQKKPDESFTEYNWDNLGGEFNLPELSCAFLYGQLLQSVKRKLEREALWNCYSSNLTEVSDGNLSLPTAENTMGNYSIFYIVARNKTERNGLLTFLKKGGIEATSHYTGLHRSSYYKALGSEASLPGADRFSDGLLRLPLYNGLTIQNIQIVCHLIKDFYKQSA